MATIESDPAASRVEVVLQKLLPLDRAEKQIILWAMSAAGGKKNVAANRLGITRMTLYRKLAEYGYPSCLQR